MKYVEIRRGSQHSFYSAIFYLLNTIGYITYYAFLAYHLKYPTFSTHFIQQFYLLNTIGYITYQTYHLKYSAFCKTHLLDIPSIPLKSCHFLQIRLTQLLNIPQPLNMQITAHTGHSKIKLQIYEVLNMYFRFNYNYVCHRKVW